MKTCDRARAPRQRSFFDGGWSCQGHGPRVLKNFFNSAQTPSIVDARIDVTRVHFPMNAMTYAATIATRMGRDPRIPCNGARSRGQLRRAIERDPTDREGAAQILHFN
jgi:hypothetical protein